MTERVHTSIRLLQALDAKGWRQVDLLEAVAPYSKRYGIKMSKGQLSQYLSGRNEPGQRRLFILALALDVSVAWLMGLDVPMQEASSTSNANNLTEEFVQLFARLSEENQRMIIQMIRAILTDK